jgi:hypothetical protein
MSRRGRSWLLVPLVGVNLAWTVPRQAGDPPPAVDSGGGRRVTIAAERAGGSYHETYRVDGGTSARWACVDVLATNPWAEPESVGAVELDYGTLDEQRTAIKRYWVLCTNLDTGEQQQTLGYLYEDQVVDFDLQARVLAERILQQRVAPSIAVGSAPAGRALVGFESWFWVDGYDGAPRIEPFDVFGRRLVLDLRPRAVRWDFGDGAVLALAPGDGFGSPTGRASTAHIYRSRSTATSAEGTVTVTVEVDVAVSYTLDGRGPFVVDPPLRATASADLVVREAQAVIGA